MRKHFSPPWCSAKKENYSYSLFSIFSSSFGHFCKYSESPFDTRGNKTSLYTVKRTKNLLGDDLCFTPYRVPPLNINFFFFLQISIACGKRCNRTSSHPFYFLTNPSPKKGYKHKNFFQNACFLAPILTFSPLNPVSS